MRDSQEPDYELGRVGKVLTPAQAVQGDAPLAAQSKENRVDERKLTYGEKAVGLTFNPSGDAKVQKLKELYAEIINTLVDDPDGLLAAGRHVGANERARMISIAIAEAQTAQMWAVKAVTWRD